MGLYQRLRWQGDKTLFPDQSDSFLGEWKQHKLMGGKSERVRQIRSVHLQFSNSIKKPPFLFAGMLLPATRLGGPVCVHGRPYH